MCLLRGTGWVFILVQVNLSLYRLKYKEIKL